MFNQNSSPRRYLRSRTRTSSIDFVPQSTVAGPALPLGTSSVPPSIEHAPPSLPPAKASPTRPLLPSYEPNNVPHVPPYALGSGVPVSFPITSPSMSATTAYTPTSPLASESPSSPSIGRSSSRVRPVSFGLPPRSEDQGPPYSPLVQPDYAPREENYSQVPLQRVPSEPSPLVPRTHYRRSSTSSSGSQIGAPRDADESVYGQPSSPQSSTTASPVRRLTSFHIPASPSTVPGTGAAGGVVRFAIGLPPRPQSQAESPRAPVSTSFRPVTSALGLGEVRTQKDADIPSKPSISASNSTRITPAVNNAITLKEISPMSDGLSLKTQSPGTVLFQTPHKLAHAFFHGTPSPSQDEVNDEAETKETPTLNDSPSSISLTLSSPVISSSVTLDKVAPVLPEEALPEISRSDGAEPDTIAAIQGPDDTSEDITSEHAPTSLISTGPPALSESPVKLVVDGAFDVKEDSDHPVIVPSDEANYATSTLASNDITTQHVPSLPLPSSSHPSTFSIIEEIPVDAEIALGLSPIVEEAVLVQPVVEPLTVTTERDAGSSSVPFVPPAFEEAPHDVEASTASESRALAPVETALLSEPVEQGSIDVSGPSELEVDLHQIESSEIGPTIPHDAETPLISASQVTSTVEEEPSDMDTYHPTSQEHIPEPSPHPISDVLEAPAANTYVEEPSIVASRPSDPETDLQHATSEEPALDSPTPWDASVADVVEDPVRSASDEQPRVITPGPPEPEESPVIGVAKDSPSSAYDEQPRFPTSRPSELEEHLAFVASEGPVLDSSTLPDSLVADVAEAPPPSASGEQPRAVTPGPPEPEEAPVVDVAKGTPSSAPVEQPGAVTPGPLEPEEAPVIGVPKIPPPSAPVEQPRAITPEPPEPEDDLMAVATERPVVDTPVINVAGAPLPSASDEQPEAPSEPADSLAPAALEEPLPDSPAIDVAEVSLPSAPDEQPEAVTPRLPGPEDSLAPAASEGPILDTPAIDVAEASLPSAPDQHPRAVTPGGPEPENDAAPAPSDVDVADVAEAPLPSASDQEPRVIAPGPPDDPTLAASKRPVLETPTHWDADITDLAAAPQLNAPIEKSESGPPDPEDDLGRIASDRPVLETSYPSDPQVSDVAKALVPSVHAGEDAVTTLDPSSAVDSPAPEMDNFVSVAPVDTGTVQILQNQGPAVEEPELIMLIDPDPDFHGREVVSHGSVLETSIKSAPLETDVVEATPPSADAEEDGTALSRQPGPEVTDREPLQVGPGEGTAVEPPEHVGQFAPDPEIYAPQIASDELNPEVVVISDRHPINAVETIPPGADAEKDCIAVSGLSDPGVDPEHVALNSLIPEASTTPDHVVTDAVEAMLPSAGSEEDALMAGSETGLPADFTPDSEFNRSPPADELISIAPLDTEHSAHSHSDAAIPVQIDSDRAPPIAPLDSKISQTSASEETSVQETEPSSNAPVPVDSGAIQSPDHGDAPTRPVLDVEAIEGSVPGDLIKVENDAPSLAWGSSPSLAVSSAPEAPVRHVGFASPMATTLDVDDATEVGVEVKSPEDGKAVQLHVTYGASAEAILLNLSQPSSAPPLMTDSVTSPESVHAELVTSEVNVETPHMSLTPTNSELALNDGFEPAKLDKPLASSTSSTTGYPSPPISDISLASIPASGRDIEADDEISQLHALPRELPIDADTLVRSPHPVRSTLGSPPSSRVHDVHFPRPPPMRNRTHWFVSLWYYFFPQIELASTIQTVPQSTGFFSIIGGFLIDMTFELSYLLWFSLSEVLYPRLHDLLRFTVLFALSLFFTIAGPFLGENGPSLHRKYTKPWVQGLPRSAPYYKARLD